MDIHSSDFDDLNLLQIDILYIIFDNGASISISLYKMDFVGPITPLTEPRTLRDMGHGTPITGIWIVQWILHTRETNLTIRSHFYHVPNDYDCLLRPQQLFSTRGGSTGTFAIGDKCAMLSLDGKLYLQITYDSKSYIYVALARNATA